MHTNTASLCNSERTQQVLQKLYTPLIISPISDRLITSSFRVRVVGRVFSNSWWMLKEKQNESTFYPPV